MSFPILVTIIFGGLVVAIILSWVDDNGIISNGGDRIKQCRHRQKLGVRHSHCEHPQGVGECFYWPRERAWHCPWFEKEHEDGKGSQRGERSTMRMH